MEQYVLHGLGNCHQLVPHFQQRVVRCGADHRISFGGNLYRRRTVCSFQRGFLHLSRGHDYPHPHTDIKWPIPDAHQDPDAYQDSDRRYGDYLPAAAQYDFQPVRC